MSEFLLTLEAARVRAGYSLQEAAKVTEVRAARLAAMEADSSGVTYQVARRVCRAYRVSVGLIYWGRVEDFHRKMRG